MLYLLTFSTLAAAAAIERAQCAPAIPIFYKYGGYPRISTNVTWGTPGSPPIETIFDTGSVAYWVYGPNATINDGSNYLGVEGPCTKKASPVFDWTKSKTHSRVKTVAKGGNVYSYGGNGKLVSSYQQVNDTMRFDAGRRPIENVQVALANHTIVRQLDQDCKIDQSTIEHSILGLAPFGVGGASASTVGPSFRKNLLDAGKISNSSFSMWFDAAPKSLTGTFTGASIYGATAPTTRYSGKLVRVPLSPPKDSYIGYYVALPTATAKNGKLSKKLKVSDTSVKECLLDSGTGTDNLPFSAQGFSGVNGVFEYTSPLGQIFMAYNGSCDSIPASATFDYTFANAKKESVTVSVPVRNYVRDPTPSTNATVCALSLTLDNYGGCVFGSPFFTAAFLNFNDATKDVGIAQGGVYKGDSSKECY